MANLDQPNHIKAIDQQDMLKSIEELPDQIEHCWGEIKNFVLPANYIRINNVVILGMGGSGIGGMLAKALAMLDSKVPVEVANFYELPKYVGTDSLVIAVSYSGGTEETLAAFREAGKRKAKLVAITTGGELASVASNFKAPVYKISYKSQPRAALGYSFVSTLGILCKLGLIDLGKDDVEETILLMRGIRTKLAPTVPTYQNEAKKIAMTLQNVFPVTIGAGVMAPVAYRWRTQINENSKHLGFDLMLPELCHNWLTGLRLPADILKQMYVLFLQSKHDHPRNKQRQNIIGQLLQKKGIKFDTITVQPSSSILAEMLLMLYLGDYVSYYMAILDEVNPTSIEEVDFLKKQLG
ncbi:MAG: bifunctional phosphoglucose/phosphomannose isomerase [bacterium]|nr:bifunctional phosphoglucose/phosphomannose isomerase [bacterium]